MQIAPKSGLILTPQVRAEKAKAIADLEEALHRRPEEIDTTVTKVAPIFVEPLNNPPACAEGDSAHFSAR